MDAAPASVVAVPITVAPAAASPVRWAGTIEAFAGRGVTHVVECGPGRVLAGLNKRIVGTLASFALTEGAAIDATRAALAA